MIIDLNDFEGRSKSVDLEIAPKGIDLDTEHARLISPVHLTCEIVRSELRARVAGRISAKFEIECTRCLEPVSFPLDANFDVEFVDQEHFGSDGEHEIDRANLSVNSLEDGRLDLKELVREQLLLNLPDQFFCREDCKGLCEICGVNRNIENCDCEADDVDPRWSALKDLK
jgi:uncharacterized protein